MRTLLAIVVLLLNVNILRAEIPSFVLVDSNKIVMPGGCSEQMDHFVEKLDSVVLFGRGRVNILHIGGSHVQADIYTNVIRLELDSLNNELRPPRGLIFPYTAAKTNNPWNYRTKANGEWIGQRNALRQFYPAQGASGILAMTSDTAAAIDFRLNTDTLRRWKATSIRLLGQSLHGHCSPRLVVDSVNINPKMDGESFVFQHDKPFDEFSLQIDFDTTHSAVPDTFVVRGLVPDNDEDGLVYHTIGVNGASVPSYLGCEKFADDLAFLRPDMVIFAIGINDATAANFTDSLFTANYDSLICRIRSVAPDCALLFISNNDSFQRRARRLEVNENGLTAQHAFRQLAEKWHGGFWDLFALMGGLGSMRTWENAGLAKSDRVHFTPAGYALVGQLFAQAWLDFYLNYDISSPDDN